MKYFDSRCRHCFEDVFDSYDFFMLKDDLWAQVSRNNKDKLLCFGCAENLHGDKFKPDDLKFEIWLNQDPIHMQKRPAPLKALLVEKFGEPTQVDYIEERACRALTITNRKLRKKDAKILDAMLAFSNYNLACEEDGVSLRNIASLLRDWISKYGVK